MLSMLVALLLVLVSLLAYVRHHVRSALVFLFQSILPALHALDVLVEVPYSV